MRSIHYLPDSARTVLIARNPKAGARDAQHFTARLADALREQGFDVEEYTDIGKLVPTASAALAAGVLRAVVSAGGDGTANLLAEQLPIGTPLAIFPLGTENLLAKYLNQTHLGDPGKTARRILQGAVVRMDSGRANGRLFVLIAGCGFDAEVVQRVHRARKGHIHYMSYAKPIIDVIRSYQYPELRLYCDGINGKGDEPVWRGRWIFVTNLPRYIIGLSLVPQADGADGLLDVCTFRAGSFWHGLRYLLGVALQQHLSWQDVRTWKLHKLRIETDAEVPFQLDGDPGGMLPVTIEVLRERLTLIVDEAWALAHGFAKEPEISSADQFS